MSSSGAYDPRRRREDNERRPPPRPTSTRERSRSPSPASEKEAARRAQMARLRAANDQEEEEKLAPPTQAAQTAARQPQEEIIQVDPEELEGLDEEEQMRKLMGLDGFGSTKGTKVASNHEGLASGKAKKHKARKYRQYMNRTGGFNKPLEKMN